MARGPRRHLKRLNAPSHWMLDKMGGMWAPRTTSGPHKLRESVPMAVLLRQRLKYALTKTEVTKICMQRLLKVDGKVRTDTNFPAGFMDVVSIEKSGDHFRMMYNTKGRFQLHRISGEETKFKLCRVKRIDTSAKGVPVAITHDARTLRYPDPSVKPLDTVKVDLATGKIVDVAHFQIGALVMVTAGRNTGRVGHLIHRERHLGSFDIVQIKDAAGATFATRLQNIFVLGKEESLISLPRAGGIKRSILGKTL